MQYCADAGKEMMNALMWSTPAASRWDCAVFAVSSKEEKKLINYCLEEEKCINDVVYAGW